jgi:hypothetical protein
MSHMQMIQENVAVCVHEYVRVLSVYVGGSTTVDQQLQSMGDNVGVFGGAAVCVWY